MIPTYLMAGVVEQVARLSSKVPEERVIVEQMARMREILRESAGYRHVTEFAEVVAREVMQDEKGRIRSKTQVMQNPQALALISPNELRVRFLSFLDSKGGQDPGSNQFMFSSNLL